MKVAAKIFIFSLILLLSGCRNDRQAGPAEGKPLFVATTGMVKDALENLVGDKAEIIALMGPGVDPHLYQATPGDLARMNRADLIVYSGLFLEGKLDDIFRKLARTRHVVNFSDAVDESNLINVTDARYAGEIYDPHIWFDIDLWTEGIAGLADELVELYPDWGDEITADRDRYIAELTELKSELAAQISAVPVTDRIMVTSHDAFQYFGRMLGIRVEALQGISTATEFGLQDRKNLVDLIVTEDINAIFIESSVGDKPIRAILSDCRERGKEVRLGGTLFSDAMGEGGTAEATYSGMLRHNVATVVEGLTNEQ
jgi:manganese/zinc/iron transport system substrate-binding protein